MSALDKFKRVSVLVGVPTRGLWKDAFGMAFTGMMVHFMRHGLGYGREELHPASMKGSILPNQRLDLVKMARARKSTHILFLDDDQTFPKDLPQRLIKHDVDFVACNIATKQIPSQPTARYFSETRPYTGALVYNDPKKGLEKVWRVGTGVALIKTSVFDKTGLNVWANKWIEELEKYQGEDWSLAEALEAHGIPLHIDHAVSEEVKHIGDFAFDHNVVGEFPQEKLANG